MSQPVDIELNLNGDYTQGVQQATTATEGLEQAVSAVQAPARGMQRALELATPSRAHLAAWGGFTAAAAYWQQQTSGVRATASAAGQSIRVLDGDVQRLARTFPVGTAGAVAMVQAVQGLGASQKQVGPLAATMERISGATSTFGPQMATSFGQLNREMASLDPSRVQRFGDVLTTVAAKSGASAQGIVDFAQAIAPVAQQAGIGESAVLGISSAFVKLGDDGGAAATAVNKILGDLNRSVREGSNDMVAYAQVTGMTVEQFRKLYQANPSQALTAVTSSIGKAGPQGQMMLESLGLEGVRTQRALLQLSQSGGLGQAINQATGAYGNNSTQMAAKQAFGGLNDSLTELRSTAGQTADALGGPFLGALTKITDVSKAFLTPLNAVLGSGPIQHGLQGVAGLMVTGMAVRRIAKPLGAVALGAQAATSGAVRAAAGGYALERAEGDVSAALGTRTGQFGQEAIGYSMFGAPYGRGRLMQRINRFGGQVGSQAGALMTDLRGRYVAPEEGAAGIGGIRGLIGRGARAGATASSMAYEAWLRSVADPYKQANTAAGERQSLLTPRAGGLFSRAGAARSATVEAETAAGTGRFAAQLKGLQASLGLVEKEGGTTSAALGRLTSSTMGAAGAMGRFVGGGLGIAGRTGLGGVASGASGLYSMLGGGIGVSMMAGTALYGVYKHQQSQVGDINATMRNTDIFGVANSWRDAVGEASKSAATMADAMMAATNTINASVKNFPAARTVSNADILAAGHFNAGDQRKNAALNYSLGGTSAVRAEIQASALGGMTPQDMQGLKMSMIKQGLPQDRIDAILAGVQPSGTGGRLTGSTAAGLVSAYGSAVASYNRHGHGTLDTDVNAGKDAQKVAQNIAGALGQQQQNLTGQFGARYATQQTARSLVDVIRRARTEQQRYTLSHALAASLGYTGKGGINVDENPAEILNLPGVSIGGMKGKDLARLVSGPTLAAHLQPSIMEAPLRSVQANALLPFFQSSQAGAQFRGGQRAAEYMAAGHEADIGAQTKAVNSMVEAASKAGTSLADLSSQATKATSVTADWQQGLLAAIAAEAQFEQQVRLQGASRGVQFGAAVGTDLRAIQAGPGTDPNGPQAKAYTQARGDLSSQRQSMIEFYQQRVTQQYQFQIQSQRAQDSYQLQMGRSQDDFFRGRQRAIRDFNIQLSRETQDAAKSLYDPYTRIQVQPVLDTGVLVGTEREQITAMRQQLANIRKLRQLGLDDQTIRQLSLYDPNKAQQTQELVDELSQDHGQIGQLNRIASTRQKLAGQMISNDPQYQRQREDFNRGLRDQQRDFNISQGRMTQDFHIAQRNMAQDIEIQDLQITNNMTKLTKDMSNIIHGRFVDLKGQVHSALTDTAGEVSRLWPSIQQILLHPNRGVGGGQTTGGRLPAGAVAPGTIASGGANVSLDSAQGAKLAARGGGQFSWAPTSVSSGTGMNKGYTLTNVSKPGTDMQYLQPGGHAGWGSTPDPAPDRPGGNAGLAKRKAQHVGWQGSEWDALYQIWQQESGFSATAGAVAHNKPYGIPQAYWSKPAGAASWPPPPMSGMGSGWQTSADKQIDWGMDYIHRRYGDPLGAWAHKRRTGWYAYGGIATAPHEAVVAEAGSPEAMIPLNSHGMGFLVGALNKYVSAAEGKLIGNGGMASATHVHISHDSYHYDSRNMFTGPITVKSDDPNEMGRKLERKRSRDNFTATRGVAWQRTS